MTGSSELTPAELSRNAKANRADGIALSDTADVYVDCNGIDASKLVFYFERAALETASILPDLLNRIGSKTATGI